MRRDVRESRASNREAKLARLSLGDLLAEPARVVLDEDLQDAAARLDLPLDGSRRPAGDGLMGAEGKVGRH